MLNTNNYSYINVDGIHVMSLSGSDYEMGYNHGLLLKDFIKTGVVPYFREYNKKVLTNTLGKILGNIAFFIIKNTVSVRIYKKAPKYLKEHILGIAAGSGISKKYLYQAFTMPDTFLWIASFAIRMGYSPIAPKMGMPTLGCTSAIAKGLATKQNNFLHGRNLDFPGVGLWEKQQAIIFYKPNGCQKYVSITSAGIPLGGFTAMNESGLTLAVHQHTSFDSVHTNGVIIGAAGDEVMRYAKNINEAKKILSKYNSIGGFTYIVGSSNESKILCYEFAGREKRSYEIDSDIFSYTNSYLSKDLEKNEHYFYPAQNRSSASRRDTAERMLKNNLGNITEQNIAEILGEKCKDSCRISESIAMLTTVSSVVFNPNAGIFYVAYGNAPVSNGKYKAFSFIEEKELNNILELNGASEVDKVFIESFSKYSDAYKVYFNNGDINNAKNLLKQAIEIEPAESIYIYIYALLCLDEKNYIEALEYFDKCINLGHHHKDRVAEMHLWRGRVYDLLNQRNNALKDYEYALKGLVACRHAAENGTKKKWKYKKPNIEFNFADVVIR